MDRIGTGAQNSWLLVKCGFGSFGFVLVFFIIPFPSQSYYVREEPSEMPCHKETLVCKCQHNLGNHLTVLIQIINFEATVSSVEPTVGDPFCKK